MKVLHVISDSNIGGAGVLLCSLLKHFDTGRVQSIVALPKGSALLARIERMQVPTVTLSFPCDRFSSASVREISALIKRERIDIVHANAALCARIAGKRCHINVIHTRHCFYPLRNDPLSLAARCLGAIWNRALSDRVIATAAPAAQNLRALGVPQKKIALIINGSDPVREVSTEEMHQFARRWNIPPHAFVVGISARLVACKGHTVFLRGARLLLDRMPNTEFCFLIAGDGPQRAYLEEYTKQLGISQSVRFLGFLSDIAPFYRTLRVNVNCSEGTETSSLALSEGMSVGVPLVVSDYGGNRSMVGDSSAGIVYPMGDAEALANAICRIASDSTLERHMREEALNRYNRLYTASRMTNEVTRVYEAIHFKS